MIKDARNARLFALILAVSFALRVGLALSGGQYFFDDEARYHRGVDLWLAVADGRWDDARAVLGRPEHAAFVWLGAALTPLQHLLARQSGHGDWSDPGNIYASANFAAALLSVFSVLNLWLIGRLARSAGANESEALWAVLLAAASNTLFYYSRHLLPYDVAMAVWLAALVLAGSARPRDRVAAGVFAGLSYHLYNGYWFLLPLALGWSLVGPAAAGPRAGPGVPGPSTALNLQATAMRKPSGVSRPRLDPWWLLGGLAGLGVPLAVGTICGGQLYWTVLGKFSGTVKQGVFAEGWSLPWEYLARAETWLGLGVAIVIGVALLRVRFRPPGPVRAWLLLLAGAYGLMVLMSTGLQQFVIYARTARPLVPLLCLVGGWAAAALLAAQPRWRVAAAVAVVAAALLQFLPHFTRVFPRDVEARVLTQLGNPKHALAVTGSIYRPLALPVARPELVLVNAQLLFPVRSYAGFPAGQEVFSLPHPLSYVPYQYEGHAPRERRLLRENDIAIKLIRLRDPSAVPDHPPADFIFTAADRPDGRDHGRP